MIGVFFGDFRLRYGAKGGRLYHRIIEMPKEGRQNLMFTAPLYDYDIRTCVPVLFLSLFTDTDEKRRYGKILSSDIYETISLAQGISGMDRSALKKEFAQVVSAKHRDAPWISRHPIITFFRRNFPKFTDGVLLRRSDLAEYLQRLESSIMIQELGKWCQAAGAYWIPQHDGFLSPVEHGNEIKKQAVRIFEEKVGFSAKLSCTTVQKTGEGGDICVP